MEGLLRVGSIPRVGLIGGDGGGDLGYGSNFYTKPHWSIILSCFVVNICVRTVFVELGHIPADSTTVRMSLAIKYKI